MLFGTKYKLSLVSGLDIRHGGIHIKQYYKVTFLPPHRILENQWS